MGIPGAPMDEKPSPIDEVDSVAILGQLETLLEQLYYWVQRAQESRDEVDDSGLAGRMLQLATANLEAFVAILLDCVRPLELVAVRMPIPEIVSAIAMRARGDVGAARVTVTGGADGIVALDVAQLTRALSAILRRLGAQGAGVDIAVARAERRGRRGVEIVLRSDAKPRASAPEHPVADLEWTLTRRIVALHGGEVTERPDARGRTIALFLPTAL